MAPKGRGRNSTPAGPKQVLLKRPVQATATCVAGRASAPGKAGAAAELVKAAIGRIPHGEMASIADVALVALGRITQFAKIQVATFRKSVAPSDRSLPWWRVVDERLMAADARAAVQRGLLEAEGLCLPAPPRAGPSTFVKAHHVRRVIDPPAGSSHGRTLVYLHGHNFSPVYYADCVPHFFGLEGPRRAVQPTPGLRVVLEPAPCRDFRETRGCAEPSWGYTGLGRSDPAGLQRVLALLAQESAKLGDPGRQLLLGGCSEGCMTGLDAFLMHPTPLAGFLGVIGLCFSEGQLLARASAVGHKRRTRLRLHSCTRDASVPWELARPSYERLQKHFTADLRLNHTSGHAVGELEGRWIREFLSDMAVL